MRKLFKTSSLLIMFISSLFSLSSALDILAPGQLLSDNETLVSANGTFALGFFTPNSTSKNSYIGIWYNKISIQTVVWVANRNNPISAHSIASLSISANGILTITAGNSTVIWSSALPTYNVSNPIAQLLDTGNFVVRDVNSFNPEFFYAWQSFDYPTDALLPGMKLGVNLKRGLNRSLTAWASLTDPSFGSQSAQYFMDIHGDPQIFLSSGPARTWRTGSWNGHNLVGVPEMKTYGLFIFQFVQNSEEVYYQYWMKDTSVVSRLLVTPSGSVNRLVWNNQVKTWDLFWYKPKDQCDSLSQCGPFGVCDVGNSPVCSCVQGFVPRDPLNWALREGSDGCIRKTKLDCKNGTDGFVTVSEAKLPDTSNSTVDWSLSLDQCRARCLRNCSCTAYASADVNGTGCLIWTTNLTDLRTWSFGGQDVYVRLAAADLGPITSDQSHRKRLLPVVIIAATILGLLLLACISCLCIKKQKIRLAKLPTISFANPYKSEGLQSKDLELPLFDLSTIMVATDNFSIQNKLGEGGFGPVFKGILEDGQIIAVKRLAKSSGQGIDEFKNEMILIAKLQHRNLVRLLGCCVHGEERMLVYEYMPNKSLDVFLFDQAKSTVLDWKTRQKIIMGIIRGLLYLHHDSRLRIIHRDLKASNILLDMEMNPKISDFGMARIFGGDDMDFNTKKVVGTYGYMSPEYAMEGIFSVKSDVFSFGVLLLEIISGTKNRGSYAFSSHLNLVGHVWSLWNEDKSLQMVDESISNSFPKYEVLKYIKIGLLCVQEHPEDRPLLSSVIQMLGSEITSLPQPKQPGFIARFIRLEKDPYLSEQGTASNEISVSTMEGR